MFYYQSEETFETVLRNFENDSLKVFSRNSYADAPFFVRLFMPYIVDYSIEFKKNNLRISIPVYDLQLEDEYLNNLNTIKSFVKTDEFFLNELIHKYDLNPEIFFYWFRILKNYNIRFIIDQPNYIDVKLKQGNYIRYVKNGKKIQEVENKHAKIEHIKGNFYYYDNRNEQGFFWGE